MAPTQYNVFTNIATRFCMDQKTQLKIEFFVLCRLLNKSNLKINQKTDILFFIQNENGMPALYATTNGFYKLQLVAYKSDSRWTTCNYSGLAVLEEELVHFVKSYKIEKMTPSKLTLLIKALIFSIN